jgi:Receptor family ligand binding region
MIGGIFSPFAGNGQIAVDQAENLAAFLMAVDHINDKTDGIADDILPNTQLKVALRTGNSFAGTIEAVRSMMDAFFRTGVLGVVSGQPTAEVEAADQMLKDFKIVQVHSVGMATDLGDGEKYPYKIQMPPIDSFQGTLLSFGITLCFM